MDKGAPRARGPGNRGPGAQGEEQGTRVMGWETGEGRWDGLTNLRLQIPYGVSAAILSRSCQDPVEWLLLPSLDGP
jgi:hypothetical protein